MLMWLILALIKKNCILPYISHNISPIQKKNITGVVGDIKTELWFKIYTSATYMNHVFWFSLKVLIYSLFLYVQTCRIGSFTRKFS